MGIEDIQISEELETNAPSIKYSGSEGPKSPQEEKLMKIIEVLMSQGMGQEEAVQVAQQMMAADAEEKQMPQQQMPQQDPRQMAAYGGIMGIDGRKQYADGGIGSWYQKNIRDPYREYVLGQDPEEMKRISQERVDSEPEGYESPFDTFLKGKRDDPDDQDSPRTGGAQEYIIPAIGGALAGLFTKGTDPENPGASDDNTALQLADLKKTANILDQKQGMAANLNFLPTVASRKFSPDDMIEVYQNAANGGRIGYNLGGRIGMAEGGLMNLGGMEKDYRAEGGFVPIGRKEKADDVPARLSVNEFVFTADAVRSAGGGDIDQGAQVMENMMKHLEQGGQVSEESQGMQGARDMFATSQRLGDIV